MIEPRISVLVVCDFVSAAGKNWNDEQASLEAFEAQDLEETFEVVLVDSEFYADTYPDALRVQFPNVKVHFLPETTSIGLKDAGVKLCSGDLIAITEADAIPAKSWLRLLVSAIDNHDEYDVVSGLTVYEPPTSLKRVMTLIDRAYMDTGSLGPCEHFSPNGAVFRRKFLSRSHPPMDETPFVVQHYRNNRNLEAGIKFLVEPGAVMVHAFGGLPFVYDLARQKGTQFGRMACLEGVASGQRVVTVARLTLDECRSGLRTFHRVRRRYLRWYDFPLYVAMLIFTLAVAVPPMWQALSGQKRPAGSAYR